MKSDVTTSHSPSPSISLQNQKYAQIDAQASFEIVESPIVRASVILDSDTRLDDIHLPLSVGPVKHPNSVTTSTADSGPIYVNKMSMGSRPFALPLSQSTKSVSACVNSKPRPLGASLVDSGATPFNSQSASSGDVTISNADFDNSSLKPAESTQSLRESEAPLSPKYLGATPPPLMIAMRSGLFAIVDYFCFKNLYYTHYISL